jgi:double-strand break repair protein MRE11
MFRCLIEPEHNPQRSFFVSQPGSTVATSLCEGEAKTKHVGILELKPEKWDFKKIRLKSVRPFVIQDIELEKTDISPKDSSSLLMFLSNQVSLVIFTIGGNTHWKICR